MTEKTNVNFDVEVRQPTSSVEAPEKTEAPSWAERAGLTETDIGAIIHQQFNEAEALPAYEMFDSDETEMPDLPERKAYRLLLKKVMLELKQSDAVRKARSKAKADGYESFDEIERKALLKVFDRARSRALEKIDLPPDQERRVRFAVQSELNHGLRYHIVHGGAPELWMLLNPKLRKIDLLSATQLRRFMQNSLAPSRDVQFVQAEAAKPDARPDIKILAQELKPSERTSQSEPLTV